MKPETWRIVATLEYIGYVMLFVVIGLTMGFAINGDKPGALSPATFRATVLVMVPLGAALIIAAVAYNQFSAWRARRPRPVLADRYHETAALRDITPKK